VSSLLNRNSVTLLKLGRKKQDDHMSKKNSVKSNFKPTKPGKADFRTKLRNKIYNNETFERVKGVSSTTTTELRFELINVRGACATANLEAAAAQAPPRRQKLTHTNTKGPIRSQSS
jgi:hypothetical protein